MNEPEFALYPPAIQGEMCVKDSCSYMLKHIGNGDYEAGRTILYNITTHLEYARKKHPRFAEGPFQALGVIGADYQKLVDYIEHYASERLQYEAVLKLLASCLRFLNDEHYQ